MTPHEALTWLKRRARHVKIGRDMHTDVADVIRKLIADRTELQKEKESLEQQIVTLQKPKRTRAFGTEGNGEWNVDDFGERKWLE